jgi:hypothetical protein
MGAAHFPAAAADSLVSGYCDDFVSLAAMLAQTLEQVSMRGIDIKESAEPLARCEQGMRDLADAIRDLLQKKRISPGSSTGSSSSGGNSTDASSQPAGPSLDNLQLHDEAPARMPALTGALHRKADRAGGGPHEGGDAEGP